MERQAGRVMRMGSRSSGFIVAPEAFFFLIILSDKVATNARPRSVPTPDPRNARPAVEVEKW